MSLFPSREMSLFPSHEMSLFPSHDTRELNQPECTMIFKVTGNFINETVIPGFIVRDTINGGAFKITFPEGFIVQEDDVLDLVIAYSWRQDPISTPQ